MKLSEEMEKDKNWSFEYELITKGWLSALAKYTPKVEALENKYNELLQEARYFYQYYPNNHRYTGKEYFQEYEEFIT